MMQLSIDFSTKSPINVEKLKGQNRKVYELLQNNDTVTLYDGLKVGVLHFHSRISDLRNLNGIVIYDRMKKIKGVSVKEYSLKQF